MDGFISNHLFYADQDHLTSYLMTDFVLNQFSWASSNILGSEPVSFKFSVSVISFALRHKQLIFFTVPMGWDSVAHSTSSLMISIGVGCEIIGTVK